MKTLNHILNTSNEMIDVLEEVARNKESFKVLQNDIGEPGFAISTGAVESLNAKIFVRNISERGVAACIETYTRMQAVLNGPKIFRPQADNLEALENMTLNVALKDYVQPFPTIIIDFPEAYCRKYEMDNVIPGYRAGSGLVASDRHMVDFVICHQMVKYNYLFVVVYLTSTDAYSTMLWDKDSEITLEEAIAEARGKDQYLNSLVTTDEEDNAVYHAIRAALNSILVIEELGATKIGPLDPERDKALKDLTLSHIRPTRRKAARELLRQPILYSFDQNVKLYDTANLATYDGDGVGSITKKPHFRRGYWRKQHYGTGNLQTKRVRIPSVLVNGHLFGGKLSDTRTIYD